MKLKCKLSSETVQWASKNTGWLQATHWYCDENLYNCQNLCAEPVTIASFWTPTEQFLSSSATLNQFLLVSDTDQFHKIAGF